ncbi:MAG: hypothetical protein A3G33_00500 [Omnitrophica bacterium RIFCSPLOWO2_12_FULL_44_17]|uniref:Uncharacterized protein n=1 Tax=Candidatus Danuiimicrobium aquiferis TaxID=1801832 RepID=A0A1G1L178_9BACT|nr:MAG: hypothetical protein A3B72_04865 [Omnitrophica bacterium RIFCSPHIGHO2_02_FULL_45_28]OGW91355.1 MAG: hypothetical protein A3E74_09195 [Omnitrophica bacterium RIFCSPHIGHO2_12_FULL_44_12]OGW98907.1 MAG: hypothetical protein A3G33_00500 [Omnitrophica bacterium RIFCSPLOWO2_12_FULL_44_17]OGX03218.1 MAG: hypothetical protein A3J12_09150 [Omnitrophica bacterium RIFCSPLOWO2_02_FULL_44_11]
MAQWRNFLVYLVPKCYPNAMDHLDFNLLRRKYKVNLSELSRFTGLGIDEIAAFETGKRFLPLETVEMLAKTIKEFDVLNLERVVNLLWDMFEEA